MIAAAAALKHPENKRLPSEVLRLGFPHLDTLPLDAGKHDMTLALTPAPTQMFCLERVEIRCFWSLHHPSLCLLSHPNKLNETLFNVQSPSLPLICVCLGASSQITSTSHSVRAPGPPCRSGEVSSGQGNPLGRLGQSWTQLEESKELNADGDAWMREAFEFQHQETQRGAHEGSFVRGHVGESNIIVIQKMPEPCSSR